MNEQEQFLKDLEGKQETSILDLPLEPEKAQEVKEETPEEDEMKLRNRREKRLAQKLEAERESSIQLARELARITEAQKLKEEVGDDYLKAVEKIYGTDTPEAKTATELLQSALKGMSEKATERALQQFREEQQKAQMAVVDAEKELDSMVDEIEEESGTVLSDSDKKGFFAMLEKMSPKDRDGNVINYADHYAVWDIYKASKSPKTDSRAKDLSSRSMVQSGSSKESKLDDDATARYLRENGII